MLMLSEFCNEQRPRLEDINQWYDEGQISLKEYWRWRDNISTTFRVKNDYRSILYVPMGELAYYLDDFLLQVTANKYLSGKDISNEMKMAGLRRENEQWEQRELKMRNNFRQMQLALKEVQ